MLEIFLTLVCGAALVNCGYFVFYYYRSLRLIEEIGKKHAKELDVVYRYLARIHCKEDLDGLLENLRLQQHTFLVVELDTMRRNIITQMGDLATKHDVIKLKEALEMNLDSIVELREKLKKDRYKNMRVAFGGKEDDN